MKTALIVLTGSLMLGIPAFAQTSGPSAAVVKAGANSDAAAAETAKAAAAAHGGDKLKSIKTLVMRGSVDMNVMGQTLPGAFSTAISGDKYRFEINSAVQSLKQVYDGKETYSSLPGFSLPPVTSLGFPLLARLGEPGYRVTALVMPKRKEKGFRITTPDGYYTEFFVDEKTALIKAYESAYEVNGSRVTTSVEVDESQLVEGITIPKKYSQRFDLGQLTAYINFKTKDILVNSKIEDDAFGPIK